MVGVAQLVECKIVILVVVGSIPIVHPIHRASGSRRPELWYLKYADTTRISAEQVRQ